MNRQTLIFNPPFNGIYVILLALAALGLTWFFYRRHLAAVVKLRPLLLLAALLRTLVLLIVLSLLAKPALEKIRSFSKLPRIAILLDQSASMSLPQEQATTDSPSRWRTAVNLAQTSQENQVFKNFRPDYYTFGQDLQAVGLRELAAAEPDLNQTDFTRALLQLSALAKNDELAAVLIFTDGQPTTGPRAEDLATAARKLGKPVFPVIFGVEKIPDASIVGVHSLGTAYLDHPLDVSVTMQNEALPSEKVKLILKEEDHQLLEQTVLLPASGQRLETKFHFTPRAIGWHKYSVSFTPLATEAITLNNQAVFYVHVIKEKMAVLIISGRPDWELGYLTRFLEKEVNLEVESLFQGLKGKFYFHNGAAAPLNAPLDALVSRLAEYELIILDNVDYPSLGTNLVAKLEMQLSAGKSLLLLGGHSAFGSGGYQGTPLAQLSPLNLKTSVDFVDQEVSLQFNPQIFGANAAETDFNGWTVLPNLSGHHKVAEIKPGAELIAYNAADKAPLVARQYYGSGKVVAAAARGFWHWDFYIQAFGEKPLAYQKFWREIISWLLTFKEDAPATLVAESSVYQLGDEVKLTYKTKKALAENNLSAQVFRGGGASREISFSGSDGKTFQARLRPTQSGDYYLKLSGLETRFTVVPPQGEFLQPAANPALAKLLAASSGGKVFSPDRLDIAAIPATKIIETQKSKVEFLNYWPLFLLLVILLGAEWLLQKFLGL